MKQRRTVFFVSDQTGVTAETMGHSLLTQFDGMESRPVTLPFITTVDKAREAVREDRPGRPGGGRAADRVRDARRQRACAMRCKQAHCLFLDFFDAFLGPLELELGQPSAHVLGRAHGMADINAYTMRINATELRACERRRGPDARLRPCADVILIGVSRSGKTPDLRLHGAAIRGFCGQLPADRGRPRWRGACRLSSMPYRREALRPHDRAPGACSRSARSARPDSRYASAQQCAFEVRVGADCFERHGVRFLRRPTHPSRRSRAACSSALAIPRRVRP